LENFISLLVCFDVMPQSGALDTMFHCDSVFCLLSSKCHITSHALIGENAQRKNTSHTLWFMKFGGNMRAKQSNA
jgi:hypothetical protein